MTSKSRSSSRSEGEVLNSDTEAKATTALSGRHVPNVNTATRLSSSRPRSPERRARRSRSRSPYRAPRGEKRRYEDDRNHDGSRNDARTFSVRYEDDRYGHRRVASSENHGSKRSRTYSRSRSRSPYRRENLKPQGSERRNGQRIGNSDAIETTTSVPHAGESRKKTATSSRVGYADNSFTSPTTLKSQTQEVSGSSHVHSNNRSAVSITDSPNVKAPLLDPEPLEANAVHDEAALIEERRKRREAIKNKYRSGAPPLLVQALERTEIGNIGSYTDSAPASPDRSGSPGPDSPATGTATSDPSSPHDISFSRDEELANNTRNDMLHEDDEPSAADYDITADMQEERARHDKRLFKENAEAQEAADAKTLQQSIAAQPPPPTQSKAKQEFDMFADEDDDMFAEAPNPQVRPQVDAKSAQKLDVAMMDNWDDADGYYITILGELIESRYHVTQNLGRGMFSSVVRATDQTTNEPVAIKIVRNNETMRKAGVKEMDILRDIAANDPEDKKHVIRLLRSFDHKGHLCMVFENLSMNLREVLKKFGRDVGINIEAIRPYAQQLFLGLSLLKKCQYIHADLKPDNILVNEGRNLLKICDLGSASPVTENITAPYLVSRFYRAPEVILGIPYDFGIDMWSIGCTLFELYTGKILFTGRNNNNMLKTIMECRGKFSHKVLRRGTFTFDYFDDLLNFRSQEMDPVTGRVVTKLVDVKSKPVRDLRSRLMPKGKKMDEQERKEVELFLDLLEKCLALDPLKRITPVDALKHGFISKRV